MDWEKIKFGLWGAGRRDRLSHYRLQLGWLDDQRYRRGNGEGDRCNCGRRAFGNDLRRAVQQGLGREPRSSSK